jgi:hypothetical protein
MLEEDPDKLEHFDRYDAGTDTSWFNLPGAIFAALTGFFVLLTLLGFFVPYGKYRSHVNKYPDLDFDFPSTATVVLHFFCGFSGALLFSILTFMAWGDPTSAWGFAVFFSGFFFLAFWIAYGLVSGYSAEFQASGNLFAYDDYTAYVAAIPAALPGVTFHASAPDRNRWSCTWSAPSFLGLFAVDNTTMPTIEPDQGQVWRVSSTVSVRWVSESADRILDTQQGLREWLRGRDPYLFWETSADDYIDGFKQELIVSDTDKLPSQFKKSNGIAAAFFWSGIVHCFEIDEVPVIRAVGVKTNAVMRLLPAANNLGHPSCHRRSSSH